MMNKEVKARLQNKTTWVSIISLILIILSNLGLYEYIGLTEDSLQNTLTAILNLLVVIGILNNPTKIKK